MKYIILALLLIFSSDVFSARTGGKVMTKTRPPQQDRIGYIDFVSSVIDSAAGKTNMDVGVYQIPITIIRMKKSGKVEYQFNSDCNDSLIDLFSKRLNIAYSYQNGIPIRFFNSRYANSYIRDVYFPGIYSSSSSSRISTVSDLGLPSLLRLSTLFGDQRTLNIVVGYEMLRYKSSGYHGVAMPSCIISILEDCNDGLTEVSTAYFEKTGLMYKWEPMTFVLAHETGHQFGFMHPVEPNGSSDVTEGDGLPSTEYSAEWDDMFDGPCDNIMGYVSEDAWKITTEQAYLIKAMFDHWVNNDGKVSITSDDKLFNYLSPPSIQIYDYITPSVVNTSVTTISWPRVTTCDRGFLGFPDNYQVFTKVNSGDAWSYVTSVDPGSFPDSYSVETALSTNTYWAVRAYDSTNGWTWEWPTNEWWTYEGYNFDTRLCTPGFLSGNCPPE